MKRNLLILILSIIYSFSYSQVIPTKGTNKIIVVTDKTAADNFKMVKQGLAEKGIEIAKQDADIYQIKTGIFDTKYNTAIFYLIYCKDHQIIINGSFKFGNDEFEAITKRGMKGSLYDKTFNTMVDFAKMYGTEIQYQTIQ